MGCGVYRVPSPAKVRVFKKIRFCETEVCRKKALKISHSLVQGVISEGGADSNCLNKSSTEAFSTRAAFTSFLFDFCGFYLGGWSA